MLHGRLSLGCKHKSFLKFSRFDALSYYSTQFWKTCLQSESVGLSPGGPIFQIATKYMGKNDIEWFDNDAREPLWVAGVPF